MAADAHHPDRDDQQHKHCLIKPMGRNGDPLVETKHLIDAALVGLLVFFSVILGDLLPALANGQVAYLTIDEIIRRTPTGLVAFGLTFVFQWLRARGIDVLEKLPFQF